MNRYHCLIILPEGTKDITVEADTVSTQSTSSSVFTKKVEYISDFGTKSIKWDIVSQYPTDRLIIESVEYDINE